MADKLFMMEGMVVHTDPVSDDWMGWMDCMQALEDFGDEYNIDCELDPFADDDDLEEYDEELEQAGEEEEEDKVDYTPKKMIYKKK